MEETFFPQSSTLTCQVYNAMDLYRYMAMAHNSSVYILHFLLYYNGITICLAKKVKFSQYYVVSSA